MKAIDLFAGPGGWDLALHSLGVEPLGIEWDDAAVATRTAAGLRTKQADVSKLDPLDFDPCELIMASAPCPTFSAAGNGGGRLLTDLIVRCLRELAAGKDTRAECRDEAYEILAPIYWEREQEKARKKKRMPDREKTKARTRRDADMSLLVVEPLRWALALQPRWVMLEQVPEVLGLWSYTAGILDSIGYNCWVGVMDSERYGVPQTRERAILMADREAPVHLLRPTHQRYVKGEPQRHEVTFEGEVLPWVSMAEALGWVEGVEPSPAPTVSGGGTGSGGGVEVFAGADSRKRAAAAVFRNGNQENAAVRHEGEPAPTITFGHNAARVQWVYERPATSVCGDPRISPPGYRGGKAEYSELAEGESPERSGDNAVRVTEEEALILQSFPPDYPVHGTKSQRFQQIGNAVPPLLAHAILSSLLAPVLEQPAEIAA